PYLVAHRGDLQSVLLEAANATALIQIQTGVLINRFNDAGDGIEIADKKFGFLIAADGVKSSLRSQIDPKASVIADGQTAWRATLPIEASTEKAVSVYMSAGAHLVTYQMGARPVLNLVYVSDGNRPPKATDFGGKAGELIKSANDWKPWPLASVHSNIWHQGRAVMIGDAAHAMTPHAAQGGAMAIEDAIMLADCVQKQPTLEAGFVTYQSQRQPRIAKVRKLSSQNRAIYQMGAVMALGRNLVTPFIPPNVLLKRLDWLYGWNS
ncbi:MAG: FAD-dependent monooxygenase, partial [Notoacmeibacter sp.]